MEIKYELTGTSELVDSILITAPVWYNTTLIFNDLSDLWSH